MERYWLFFLCFATCLWGDLGVDPASGLSVPARRKSAPMPSQNDSQIFFHLELLVWDALEEGLEYAYQNSQTQFAQNLTSFEPPSQFEPAFRLGFGSILPYDHWTLEALYTYYSTNRHALASFAFDTTGSPGPGMISVWSAPSAFDGNLIGARFINAANQWRLHASFLDLSLSRPSAISSFFSLEPLFGLRSAWLHQLIQINYSSGNLAAPGVNILSSHINMRCDSNNVGPLFGCKAFWDIGKRWNVFVDGSGALLASYFSLGRNETDLYETGSLQTEVFGISEKGWMFRPQGQLSLGIKFHDDFFYGKKKGQYHISLAYEAEMWWKQNQFLRYIDLMNASSSGANTAPTQGNLLFHGANLEVQCGF